VADDIKEQLRNQEVARLACTVRDQEKEIERLRTAGDALAHALRVMVDETVLRQLVMFGSVEVAAAPLRAVTAWNEVRRG